MRFDSIYMRLDVIDLRFDFSMLDVFRVCVVYCIQVCLGCVREREEKRSPSRLGLLESHSLPSITPKKI